MELTLDDYLAEFDRWKERAADKRKAREDGNQPAFSDESLIRMEERIGQPLPRVAPSELRCAGTSAPREPAQAPNPS
jgi:hypothetical protein